MLPNNVARKNSVRYGSALPYELTMVREHVVVGRLSFYISDSAFRLLSDDYSGQGRCYAYCDKIGRWCRIKVFKWRVVKYRICTEEEIKEILEELFT